MDTIDVMLSAARAKANEPLARGYVNDTELVEAANEIQRSIAAMILEADESYYDQSDESIGFVADQEEYDLPRGIRNRKVTKVTRIDLDEPVDVEPIRWQDKNLLDRLNRNGALATDFQLLYYLRGEKIGFKPTPPSTVAAAIRINYQQLPHDLHWAQVDSQSTTTFVMPTSTTATPPYLKAGRISTSPDYYVGARIRMITGDARGTERQITAWNAATRVATIDSAWTEAQVDNQDYVILSPLAHEYKDALLWAMVQHVAVKSEKAAELYQMAEVRIKELKDFIRGNVTPRNVDVGRYIKPPQDWME